MNNFFETFSITEKGSPQNDKDFYKDLPKELFETLDLYGGDTFNNGLYRVHSFKSSVKWSLLLGEYFTAYQSKVYPFGFDWMGRQFTLNKEGNMIFVFIPATLEVFEIEKTLSIFHKEELSKDILEFDWFNQVFKYCGIQNICYNECIGSKRSLFLGGKDVLENYEKQDMEVYWHMENEIYNQIKDLPEGTKIDKVIFIPLPNSEIPPSKLNP